MLALLLSAVLHVLQGHVAVAYAGSIIIRNVCQLQRTAVLHRCHLYHDLEAAADNTGTVSVGNAAEVRLLAADADLEYPGRRHTDLLLAGVRRVSRQPARLRDFSGARLTRCATVESLAKKTRVRSAFAGAAKCRRGLGL